jgi:hypothetical protein
LQSRVEQVKNRSVRKSPAVGRRCPCWLALLVMFLLAWRYLHEDVLSVVASFLLTATRRVNSLEYMYSSRLARVDGVAGVEVDAILMMLRLMPTWWCWDWRQLDEDLRLAYYLESKVKLSNLFFWRKFFRKWGRV